MKKSVNKWECLTVRIRKRICESCYKVVGQWEASRKHSACTHGWLKCELRKQGWGTGRGRGAGIVERGLWVKSSRRFNRWCEREKGKTRKKQGATREWGKDSAFLLYIRRNIAGRSFTNNVVQTEVTSRVQCCAVARRSSWSMTTNSALVRWPVLKNSRKHSKTSNNHEESCNF